MLLQDQPQRPSTSPRSIARLMALPPGHPVISFKFAPNTLRRSSAKLSVSEPVALPPLGRAGLRISAQILTGEVYQVAQTLVSLVILPIQVNFIGSNFESPKSGSVAMPRVAVAMTVPSRGARL